MDFAVAADSGFGIDDDGAVMLKLKPFREATCADDKAQTGSKSVLSGLIPVGRQFLRFGEGVSLFFPEKSQIPSDIVLFWPDEPFEDAFFAGHAFVSFFSSVKS